MHQHIPGLLYTVRMIFATSRYYNTTKQISTLLVKVTNQILNMCMNYLTNNGAKTIWNQDKHNFINKAKVCMYVCISLRIAKTLYSSYLYNATTLVREEYDFISFSYFYTQKVESKRVRLVKFSVRK